MKPILRLLPCLLLALCLLVPAAQADSPVGSWSGSASAMGRSGGASATFSANGSCSLSAAGYSGSGTWSGGQISISGMGHSATLSYSCSGNSMTISGSFRGISASMSLTRTGGGGGSSGSSSAPLYREWRLDDGSTALRLYEDGWLLWKSLDQVPVPVPEDDPFFNEATNGEWGARFSIKNGKLLVTPLESAMAREPESWPLCWSNKAQAWVVPFKTGDNRLRLFDGDHALNWTLIEDEKLDKKPHEPLFYPYISIRQGDSGEVVRLIQQRLIELGHLQGKADGKFGPLTGGAVSEFARAQGMPNTSAIGGELLQNLFS